jgi:hypothetical protein
VTSLLGSLGWRADVAGRIAIERALDPAANLGFTVEARGFAEDGLPWPVATVEAIGALEIASTAARLAYLVEWPTGRSTQQASLSVGDRWRGDVSLA